METTGPKSNRTYSEQGGFKPIVFAALLLLVISVSFFPVLTGQASFFFRDFGIFSYPIAQYHRESIWNGEIPLWNPYNNLGIPFLAQWNTMVFYPLTIIYLLLPLPLGVNLFCLFHLWLAGFGMYYLARHWTQHSWGAALAGLGFCFNGLTLSCLKWPNNMAALGWMPWVILAMAIWLKKGPKTLPVVALVGATQMLSGAPEIILLTWCFCTCQVGVVLWQGKIPKGKIIFSYMSVAVLVAGLCAVQLLPFLDLLRQSQRDHTFAASVWPMPIWGWANFLVPLFRTFPSYHHVPAQPEQYWISTYYLGLPILFGAIIAVIKVKDHRVRVAAGLVFVFLWMALGDAGGLYLAARKIFPLISVMRFPIKFVVLPVFCLCLMAAFGIAWFDDQLRTRNFKEALALGKRVGLWLLFGIVLITCFAPIWPHEHEGWATTLDNGLQRSFFALATLALFIVWSKGPITLKSPVGHWIILSLGLVLYFDVRFHSPWQNPTVSPVVYQQNFVDFQRPELGKSRAMISPFALLRLDRQIINDPWKDYSQSRRFMFCNCNLLDRIPKVDGFYALELKHTAELIHKLTEGSDTNHSPLMQFLSVGILTTSARPIAWQEQGNPMPWVTAGQQVELTNSFAAVLSHGWDPVNSVFVDETPAGSPRGRVDGVRILGLSVDAHRVTFQAVSPAATIAVHNQAWSKNWKAIVNGTPATLLRVNHAFQGILIPAGTSEVELRYEDRAFQWGALISILCVVWLGILFYKDGK